MKKNFNSLWGRLLLAFAAPVVLFLGASLVAYVTIHRLLVVLDSERRTEEILSHAYKVKESIAGMAAAKGDHHLTGEEIHRHRVEQQYKEILHELHDLRTLVAQDSAHLAALDEVEVKIHQWHQITQTAFDQRQEFPGKNWEKLIEQFRLARSMELMESIRAGMNHLIEAEKAVLQQRRSAGRETTRESVWAISVAIFVTVVLSMIIAILSARSIIKPIHHLQNAFTDLRQGQFETIIPYGPTEIAELIRGFNLTGIALAERTTLLESSELRYRTVVGTTSALLWITDASGVNREMKRWCAFTGQDEQNIIGEGWLQAVHPEDREGFVQRWQTAMANKQAAEHELRIRNAKGAYRHFHCRGIPIFDSNNDIVEWVQICVDITDKKQEEALRREKEAAEAANRAKSEFLAKMSHELRTPLNAVIGMSKMLTSQRFGAMNEKQLDYLADITQAGEHLLELINDILDLSKVEAGRMELTPEPIAVNQSIEAVLSTFTPMIDERKLVLEKHLLPVDGTIITDLARFKQVLFNLLSNAVKFTPESGCITIRAGWISNVTPESEPADLHSARGVRVEVEDTGIGIEEKDRHKIGQEFFQANRTSHQALEGTGLGLALTYQLVHLMGGQLWFTSEAGKGSCFAIVLPLYLGQDADEGIGELESRTSRVFLPRSEMQPGAPLALIIDDHAPTNKLLSDWLHDAGLNVVSAFDGRQGLDKALQSQPQLILLDIRLPRLNGLQVLTRLKSNPKTADIPIFVVSALEGYDHLSHVDIVDWFVKPVDKEHLLRRLQTSCPDLFDGEEMWSLLLLDKDHDVHRPLLDMFSKEQIQVVHAEDEIEALEKLNRHAIKVIVIDFDMSDLKVIRAVDAIRSHPEYNHIPIMLTVEQIDTEELHPIGDNIQVILNKRSLVKEEFLQRLHQLGLPLVRSAQTEDVKK